MPWDHHAAVGALPSFGLDRSQNRAKSFDISLAAPQYTTTSRPTQSDVASLECLGNISTMAVGVQEGPFDKRLLKYLLNTGLRY